jgi:hypothetical protein
MAFMRVPHITRRDVAVVFVTALACFGIAAATTGASSPRHHHFYAAPGDLISVRAVDLLCHVYANDPTHHEYSPALFCVRASKPGSSRAFGATNNYAWMDGQNTRSVEDRFARKP